MPHTQYTVGSAFAQALRQATDLDRHEDADLYRIVDLINVGIHCSHMARSLMERDPAEARAMLIHGASRMLAAAERIDAGDRQPVIVPLPIRRERPNLRVVS